MNLADELTIRTWKEFKVIAVIGDALIDSWVHGVVSECQDGCPKFLKLKTYTTPGGAANAAQCLQHWNCDTTLICQVTRSVKQRFVDQSNRIVFRCDDESPPVKGIFTRQRLETADAVLFSDYDKGFLTPQLIREVVEFCRERKIPCIADCKRPPSTYAGCILKCNNDYYNKHQADLFEVCPVVRTFGSEYPDVYERPERAERDPSLAPVTCVNHVGAGDCFAAHLTLALAHGFTLEQAAQVAHSAGRVYVQHPHNRAPLPHEVVVDLSSIPWPRLRWE